VGLLRADAVKLKRREKTDNAARHLPSGFRERLALAEVCIGPGIDATGDSLNEPAAMQAIEIIARYVFRNEVAGPDQASGSDEFKSKLNFVFDH
jgi:hypothetical protein